MHTPRFKFKAAHSAWSPAVHRIHEQEHRLPPYICNVSDLISCMKNKPVIHCIFCFSINLYFIIFQTQTKPNRFIPTSTCSRTWRWVKRLPLTSCVYFYIKEMSQMEYRNKAKATQHTVNAMASTLLDIE